MKANLLSSPTFRYLGGNFADVEFEQVTPKPWEDSKDAIQNQEEIKDLISAFSTKKIGINEKAVEINNEKSNSRKVYNVKQNIELETINYNFDENNKFLLDDIKIQANENTSSNFLIDYKSDEDIQTFRNSILYVYAKENSKINIYLVSRESSSSKSFQSIGVITKDNAVVNIYQVDLGVGNKVLSCLSYVEGTSGKLNIEGSYFLDKQQNFDMLYNVDILGTLSEVDINFNGILKDKSKKIFRGTLDFKRGSKASKGSEIEYVTLLDKDVRSKSLPIILCTEENITGNHAASAGQIDENMLFYLMTRGYSLKEAKSLIVKARLVPVIDKIPNEKLRQELIETLKNKMVNEG